MTRTYAVPSMTAIATILAFAPQALLAQAEAEEATPFTEEAAPEPMEGEVMTAEPATDPAAEGQAMAADGATTAMEPTSPGPEMQAVLDKLVELGADPIGTLPPEDQRQEPTLADAVMALMEEQGIEPDPALTPIATRDITIPGAAGDVPARVYTPEGEGPFPLIMYIHGGGWVIANLDVYDATPRQVAAGAEAVVVSVSYRQAPENKFPAAHEDVNAAYAWVIENSGSLNADAERVAVAGESAGGNLAMNVAIHARDAALTQPDHMLLVYPVAGNDMETPSYQTYADAQPLSRAGMMWFVEHVFTSMEGTADPRINLVGRPDLAGLPPATIVNAEIDPLASEGEQLAASLEAAGVAVTQMTYPAVTHEFFGMGAVVPTAKEAMDMSTSALREALAVE